MPKFSRNWFCTNCLPPLSSIPQGNYVACIVCILDDTFMKDKHYQIFIDSCDDDRALLVRIMHLSYLRTYLRFHSKHQLVEPVPQPTYNRFILKYFINLLAMLHKSLDRAISLYIFIHEIRLSGVSISISSISIVHIRRFY